MKLTERQVQGAVVIDLSGVGIGAEPSILHELVNSRLARGHRQFVLGLEKLQSMDSTCLAEIVASFKAVVEAGGTLKMASPSPHIRRSLHVTRIDTLISTYDSVTDAVASFATTASGSSTS
jgi:anti-anti-sigma factor